MLKDQVDDPHHLDLELRQKLLVYPEIRYAIETSRPCATNQGLTTEQECRDAMSTITGSVQNFNTQEVESMPAGCYRKIVDTSYSWFFNKISIGTITSDAEPVCKGKRISLRAHNSSFSCCMFFSVVVFSALRKGRKTFYFLSSFDWLLLVDFDWLSFINRDH